MGSIPIPPTVSNTLLVFLLSAYAEAVIQEIVSTVFRLKKEMILMSVTVIVALLGSAGGLGK